MHEKLEKLYEKVSNFCIFATKECDGKNKFYN